MTNLVLFDIDGTILNAGGVGSRAILSALEAVFGMKIVKNGYRMSGKTDPLICIELMEAHGLDRATVEDRLPDVWPHYLSELKRGLQAGGTVVFPGLRPLIEHLSTSPDVLLGLLTGNVRLGAEAKLEAVAMWDSFRIGAFGDDSVWRPELPAFAVQRAEEMTGHLFTGKSIVVIGDTPSDISCGRHLGVKTLAVATGTYSAAQLSAHSPDHLFEDLADTERVLSSILE